MYSLRLVTPMGSLDYKHQEAFDRFKSKIKYQNPECPNCKHSLDHIFFQYTDEGDHLMVRIDFYCKGCEYTAHKVMSYQNCCRY
jgi:C4-type Zn-finger protein